MGLSEADYRQLLKQAVVQPALAKLPSKVAKIPSPFDPFVALCAQHGLPKPEQEYRFLPERQFRADYCWPERKLIVEKHGGLWSKHARAKAAHAMPLKILRDYEKANLAQLAGFVILQYTPEQLLLASTLETLKTLFTYER